MWKTISKLQLWFKKAYEIICVIIPNAKYPSLNIITARQHAISKVVPDEALCFGDISHTSEWKPSFGFWVEASTTRARLSREQRLLKTGLIASSTVRDKACDVWSYGVLSRTDFK